MNVDKNRLHRVAYLVALVGICQFSIFGFVAMLCYPGGTPFDSDTSGYCFWSNTLSDLGREVSISGQPNRTGALVFRASLATATVLGAGIWLALPGMFRSRRRLGLAVRVAGGTYVAAMIATALTPTDTAYFWHMSAIGLMGVAGIAGLLLSSVGVVLERRKVNAFIVLSTVVGVLAAVHFYQYANHFWFDGPWTPAAPAVQKLLTIGAIIWIGAAGPMFPKARQASPHPGERAQARCL